ncbi:hypothetical protein PO909_030018 [Leuciscus waleckii]
MTDYSMAEKVQKRSFEIKIHCLQCHEPQEDIASHLATVCLRDSTDAERAAEVQRAEASARNWIRNGRVWDFQDVCTLLPDRGSQVALTKELIQRGFLVSNQPDMDTGGEAPSLSAKYSSADIIVPSHCQKRSIGSVLNKANTDVEMIRGDLQVGRKISNADMTLYRYYCEAILVYRHMQLPGAVEDFTDAEWVGRVIHGSRVILRTERKTSVDIAPVLPDNQAPLFNEEKGCNRFFLSSSGDVVHSVSQDMSHLHSMNKLGMTTSQDVHRAVGVEAKFLTAHQQDLLNVYLARDAGEVLDEDLVEAAKLISSMAGTCSDEGTAAVAGTSTRWSISQFLEAFPVSLQGQPPSKRDFLETEHFTISGGIHNMQKGKSIFSVISVSAGLPQLKWQG